MSTTNNSVTGSAAGNGSTPESRKADRKEHFDQFNSNMQSMIFGAIEDGTKAVCTASHLVLSLACSIATATLAVVFMDWSLQRVMGDGFMEEFTGYAKIGVGVLTVVGTMVFILTGRVWPFAAREQPQSTEQLILLADIQTRLDDVETAVNRTEAAIKGD